MNSTHRLPIFVAAAQAAAFILLLVLPFCPGLIGGHNLSRQANSGMAATGTDEASNQGDYFHWDKLPVRLYIATHSAQEDEWARTAVAGFDEWAAATGGAVGYTRVDDPDKAQITVEFSAEDAVPDHPDLVGLTTTWWDGPVLQKAHIILAAGQKSPSDLQTAAAHELGHALGIRGHSNDRDDLMFAAPIRAGDVTPHEVTSNDVDSLKICYPALFAQKQVAQR